MYLEHRWCSLGASRELSLRPFVGVDPARIEETFYTGSRVCTYVPTAVVALLIRNAESQEHRRYIYRHASLYVTARNT